MVISKQINVILVTAGFTKWRLHWNNGNMEGQINFSIETIFRILNNFIRHFVARSSKYPTLDVELSGENSPLTIHQHRYLLKFY